MHLIHEPYYKQKVHIEKLEGMIAVLKTVLVML